MTVTAPQLAPGPPQLYSAAHPCELRDPVERRHSMRRILLVLFGLALIVASDGATWASVATKGCPSCPFCP